MKDYKKILQLNSEGKSKNEISQCLWEGGALLNIAGVLV